MNSLPETVRETILKHKLILPGECVLAGVSGGADSVCLLLVLHALASSLSFSLHVVHVEHGLRGEAGRQDAMFTRQLCDRLHVSCLCRSADVKGRARQEGWSLEEAGRNLRREIFLEEAERLGAHRIALAHNQNDQAETLLFHLARGSGIHGMGGIRVQNGPFIRPLLHLSRPRIEQYLQEQGQAWCTDATNLENAYARNRIRNQVLPLLEEQVNRGAVRHLAEAAGELQEADRYLRMQALPLLQAGFSERPDADGGDLNLDCLEGQSPLIRRYVLRLFLEKLYADRGLRDVTRAHVEMLEDLAEGSCGRELNLPQGLRVLRDKDALHGSFEKEALPSQDPGEVVIRGEGTYEFGGRTYRVTFVDRDAVPDPIPAKPYTKWIGCDTITGELCFRHQRRGDYLTIHAAGGRKKLKDYMIDEKIPARQRDAVVVLAEGARILWVVGYRLSEDAKVTESVGRIMKVEG